MMMLDANTQPGKFQNILQCYKAQLKRLFYYFVNTVVFWIYTVTFYKIEL